MGSCDTTCLRAAKKTKTQNRSDIATKIQICDYSIAKQYLEKGKYDKAKELFTALKDYGDSKEMIKECSYRKALSLIEGKKYEDAVSGRWAMTQPIPENLKDLVISIHEFWNP